MLLSRPKLLFINFLPRHGPTNTTIFTGYKPQEPLKPCGHSVLKYFNKFCSMNNDKLRTQFLFHLSHKIHPEKKAVLQAFHICWHFNIPTQQMIYSSLPRHNGTDSCINLLSMCQSENIFHTFAAVTAGTVIQASVHNQEGRF